MHWCAVVVHWMLIELYVCGVEFLCFHLSYFAYYYYLCMHIDYRRQTRWIRG
jgi:hypothetical protein